MTNAKTQPTLVLGGPGETGRRVARRLTAPGAVKAVGSFARLAMGNGASRDTAASGARDTADATEADR